MLREIAHFFRRLWNRQGCNMNRRTDRALQEAGLVLAEVEPFQLFVDGLPSFPSLLVRARPEAGAGATTPGQGVRPP